MSKEKPKYYNIKVNLTEQDLFELQSGKEFNWNWNTEEDDNVIIKLNLIPKEEDDDAIISKEITEEEAIKLAKEISRIGLKEKTPCECSICLYDGDCNEE